MSLCIFCKKQTENKYSYYQSGHFSQVKEHISVHVCTKCFRKKKAIIYSSVTLFFLFLVLFGTNNSSATHDPSKDEVNPVITLSVITLIFAIPAGYNIFCILKDRRVSDAYSARKLIRHAAKASPGYRYYTPAEYELITADRRSYPLYTGSGLCDVCNRSLRGVNAYVVPNSVFYGSPEWRAYFKKVSLGYTDADIERMRMMDTSQGSAVCENCIHMF
jgi:hypothetical protein